jgi:hypothetical protein
MNAPFSASFGLAAALVAGAASSPSAQTPPRPVASKPAQAAKTFTPPRTPWGDPDLQGNYTNKYEQGTPFERPEEFAGRKIEDLKNDD